MTVYGSAIIATAQVALSSDIVAVSTYNRSRRFVQLTSTSQFFVYGSTTGSSTNGHVVPANVPFTMSGEGMSAGALYGGTSTGLTGRVSTISW